MVSQDFNIRANWVKNIMRTLVFLAIACDYNYLKVRNLTLKREVPVGAWVVQLVKHPTLDFGSCHDVMFREIEPCIGV